MQPHHHIITETLFRIQRIQPGELAPVLASYYLRYTHPVAASELQQLADALSRLSVAVSGFIMAESWQREETAAAEAQRPQDEKRLTVKEAAQRMGLTQAKVYKMIQAGQLSARNLNEKNPKQRACYRIRESDLPI